MNGGRRLLFHRDFRYYTGGHGKVWDYFIHALALGWDARVYLTPQSVRDASNPWLALPQRIEAEWQPSGADVLFVGGMDWLAVSTSATPPVINLIQHVRHADPVEPLYGFLPRRAARICVSTPVADALRASGRVNGPLRVIPAGLALADALLDRSGADPMPDVCVAAAPLADITLADSALTDAAMVGVALSGAPMAAGTTTDATTPGTSGCGDAHADAGIFIAALKDPPLGLALAARLRADGHAVDLCVDLIPRVAFLARLRAARLALLLPHATEGFYLPGLEAMALGRPLLMFDAIGNREYARDGDNCLLPARTVDACVAAVARLDDPALAARLIQAGHATAARYSLTQERAAFAEVLTAVGTW